jgi:hypothetical protein
MQGKGRNRVAVERSGATCQIAFVDAGPGIPPDLRDKIFTLFFTTKTRGAGLGQPTVKRLVEAHNGQIAIDCPPTGGTTWSSAADGHADHRADGLLVAEPCLAPPGIESLVAALVNQQVAERDHRVADVVADIVDHAKVRS